MVNVALIFPGQGAQKVGMGRKFYESSPEAKAVFEQADSVLKNGLKDVIFEGPQEKLTSTAYCQPAILTMCVAALKALEAHSKYQNISPQFAAGLSLGEYCALTAAGALSFEDTLKLVERRSFYMEEATKNASGKMAAIIGLDKDKICAICQETGVEIANFNSPQQIVITGHAEKVEAASKLLSESGAKSVIPLDVSGAFHSALMQPAAEKFAAEAKKVTVHASKFPVISNVDGQPEATPEDIRRNLARQITSSVQWVDSIKYMAAQGISDFIEIGPGKVLKGLIRRIDSSLKVYNIEIPEDIEKLP